MTLDVFLIILRLLFIVLLYLFLMQVVIAITRDLRKTAAANDNLGKQALPVVGHLIVVDSGPSNILPGTHFELRLWYVQDAGSTNGTYVNNQLAREALAARFGDIIQVGFIRFKLAQ